MIMELNKIYIENCLETMKRMPDELVDLTVTSPPYDDLRTYNGIIDKKQPAQFGWYSFDFESIAKELYRITKPGGVVVWVVGDAIDKNGSETLTSFRQALFFKECGFNMHDTMIYQKAGMRFPEKKRYNQIFEYMFVFSKGTPKTVNLIMDRPNRWAGYTNWGSNSTRDSEGNLIKKWVKEDGTVKEVKDCKRYRKYGTRFNIWLFKTGFGFGTKDKDSHKHPAIFPEALAEDHILSWSNVGDIVYDPFMGSGTTAKMSVLLNRQYVGSEIDAVYAEDARKRLIKAEDFRGTRLNEFQEAQSKRDAEEKEHVEMVEKNVSETATTDKKKKWQPPQPDKVGKSNFSITDEAEDIQKSMFSSETE